MQHNGYILIPVNSYLAWKTSTNGNGYNVDGAYGDQCWDFCALLYWQYDLTLVTVNGTAAGCWYLARSVNSQPPFEAVTGKSEIKRGDIIVFGANPISSAGHICFADEDYHGNFINCLGQNQRGNGSGHPVTLDSLSLNYFAGIFRRIIDMS
jgi:hypothetical protein